MSSFIQWRRLYAEYDQKDVRRFLKNVGDSSESAFVKGMKSQHSGSLARRKNGSYFRRSSANDYPAIDSGRLLSSVRSVSDNNSVSIGTNTEYSRYLREGTNKMARRRMSDDALDEGIKNAGKTPVTFFRWRFAK